MKISLVVDRMNIWGGVETHIRDLCHELLANKHEISIITGEEGIASDPLKKQGIKVVECPEIIPDLKRPDRYLKSIFKLTSILREQGSDVVHSHNMGSEMPTRISSRLLNIPSVHTVHCSAVGNNVKLRTKLIWGGCHSIASAFNQGHTIFVSNFNRDHSLKRGYVNPHMSSTIYNGVPDIAGADMGKLKIANDNEIRLVMVARLSPEKDHATVLAALSQMKDLNWSMDFAGKGDQKSYIALAEEFGVADKCNFLGEVSDIPELLSEKDILVHASHQEALGIAIIEGMRAKLPVIASHVGGIPELVSHDCNGYTFPDCDADMLAGQLTELMQNKSLRSAMGAVGRSIYENNFKVESMASKTQDVYSQVLEKHQSKIHIPRPSFLRYNAS